MRIAVVGAGIIGVCTAHALAAEAHEVTVFEQQGSAVGGSSFAAGGLMGAARLAAWHGLPNGAGFLGDLWQASPQLHPGGARRLPGPGWMWSWCRHQRPSLVNERRRTLWQLGRLNQLRSSELSDSLKLQYEQTQGCMVLIRDARAMRSVRRHAAALTSWGSAHGWIDEDRCRSLEPGLSHDARLIGALLLFQDGAGNCRHFGQLLKAEAERMGARFACGQQVVAIEPGPKPRLTLRAPARRDAAPSQEFDAVVICTGSDSAELLRPLRLRLPLLMLHAHSVTAPIRHIDGHADTAPRGSVFDARTGTSICRLGQRVRVSGGLELGGTADRANQAALRVLYGVLDEWFPGATMRGQVQHWKGGLACTPDGLPLLGRSAAPGVWLNLAHGSQGWSLACGSARVLADALTGRAAAIDLRQLAADRFQR
jgi:D-amino-acid dehydrogenase